MSLLVLLGGIDGMFAGLGLQVWVSAIAYPLNIGGRPFISWPMFIPVTFELTILFASFAAVLSDARAERAADAVSPGVQRRAIRRTPARTGSSWRSKRPIRSSISTRTSQFLQGLGARGSQ